MTQTAKSYFFLTSEDALVFAAKVNSRREALGHYETAMKRDDLTQSETEFLERQIGGLKSQIAELLAA